MRNSFLDLCANPTRPLCTDAVPRLGCQWQASWVDWMMRRPKTSFYSKLLGVEMPKKDSGESWQSGLRNLSLSSLSSENMSWIYGSPQSPCLCARRGEGTGKRVTKVAWLVWLRTHTTIRSKGKQRFILLLSRKKAALYPVRSCIRLFGAADWIFRIGKENMDNDSVLKSAVASMLWQNRQIKTLIKPNGRHLNTSGALA